MVEVTGSYAVGTACFSLTDDREELLGNGGKRKIAVRVYYPASKESVAGKQRAAIFSEKKGAALAKAYHIKDMAAFENAADYYENAEPVSGEKFPLVMYSHGYNSYVESNTYLCTELASQGYVVASVGHAYEAVENDYDDGSCDYYDKKLGKLMFKGSQFSAIIAQTKLLKKKCSPEQAYSLFDAFQRKYTPFMSERVKVWGADTLAALNEVKSRYAEIIDLTYGVGVTGHSFGGAAAYYLCQTSDEFSCGINIDGSLFGDYSGMTMKKPFYQISCKENVNVETKPLLDTEAPVYRACFNKMKHIGFTDAKFFVPVKFLVGTLEPMEMEKNLNACHIGFFDRYLKNKTDAVVGENNETVEFTAYE